MSWRTAVLVFVLLVLTAWGFRSYTTRDVDKPLPKPSVTLQADVSTLAVPVPAVKAPEVVGKVAVPATKLRHIGCGSECQAYKLAYANAVRANALLGHHEYSESAKDGRPRL